MHDLMSPFSTMAKPLVRTSYLRRLQTVRSLSQQKEDLLMKQHESLATQLFQKVDTDGGGNIEAEEVAALSARLGNPLTKTQLTEAMD